MKRPLMFGVLLYISGLLVGQYFTNWVIALFFVATISILLALYKLNYWKTTFALILFFALGIFCVNISLSPKNMQIDSLANKEVKITGTAVSSATTAFGYKAAIKTTQLEFENKIQKSNITVQIFIEEAISLGQPVTVQGTLEKFDFQRNPAGFNEFLFYKSQKIDYKMKATLLQKGNAKQSINLLLHNFRERIKKVYENTLPAKEAGIMKAYVLGDTSALDEGVKILYKKAGLYHVLAISGSHITLLSEIIYLILLKLNIRKRPSAAIVIIAIVLYTIMSGSSISAVRAMLIAIALHFGAIIRRETDALTSISLAAFILLLYQPLYLWDIGFQLSFSAVLALLLFVPPLTKKLIMPRALQTHLVSCAAATFLTYPLLAYHFYNVPLLSLLVNILLLPLTSTLLVVGLLVGIIGYFSAALAAPFCAIIYSFLKLFEVVCNFSTSLAFSDLLTGRTSIISIFLYYGFFATGVTYIVTKNKKWIRGSLICYTAFLLLVLIMAVYPKKFEMVFLDVGQGDCTYIQTPKNNILIDGGGSINKEIGDNVGLHVVYPYLLYKKVNTLDAVFVTHPDGDHIIGIIELLDLVKIKNIYVSNVDFSKEWLYNMLIEKATEKNIPVHKISAGTTIQSGTDLNFKVIYPQANQKYETINSASTVMQMNYKGKTVLFTGDTESNDEQQMLLSPIKSDILKVAHHGSKTSSTYEFVSAVAPFAAICGVSKSNTYGHPSPSVVETYKQLNIPLYTTAQNGTITISYKNNTFQINFFRGKGIYERAKG